jgi:MoxR-like ATPase
LEGFVGYQHIFRPDGISVVEGGPEGRVYVYDDETVVLTVNIALATNRPLLVYGAAGSGKSTLAPNIAGVLGWKFLQHTITSRTEAEDLLWQFDAVHRLSDAQSGSAKRAGEYYRPGVLWRAFTERRAVVLIDEIDKADPDLPNGLLGPLGSFAFEVPDGRRVSAPETERPLIVITTNDERDLPRPFLRRCVVLTLKPPSKEHLLTVAQAHLAEHYAPQIASIVADQVLAGQNGSAASTAEFLDTLRACQRLDIGPASPEWLQLTRATLVKSTGTGS